METPVRTGAGGGAGGGDGAAGAACATGGVAGTTTGGAGSAAGVWRTTGAGVGGFAVRTGFGFGGGVFFSGGGVGGAGAGAGSGFGSGSKRTVTGGGSTSFDELVDASESNAASTMPCRPRETSNAAVVREDFMQFRRMPRKACKPSWPKLFHWSTTAGKKLGASNPSPCVSEVAWCPEQEAGPEAHQDAQQESRHGSVASDVAQAKHVLHVVQPAAFVGQKSCRPKAAMRVGEPA
jgi:hypothetical protein